MKRYALSHLSDEALLRDLAELVARDRITTAEMLAHIAEVDARKLYVPAAYPSMFAYCVGELRLSEDAAFNRIRAGRTARQFPAIFEALADGRLHLGAVLLLTPYLSPETADELLRAATHKSKPEIERLLAERFPRPDMLAWVETIPASSVTPSAGQQALGPVVCQLVPGRVGNELPPTPTSGHGVDRSRVKPLGPQSFAVQFTLSQSAHDKLRYAQALLGHQVPSGDIAEVFERALDSLIERLEKRKIAATNRPRCGQRRGTASQRYVPADVKRAVWQRDGGRCTFESEAGRRCPARSPLELDHVLEVARGGEATVDGVRLRCRAHNQYGAECTFGSEFMRHKRIAAAEARAAARQQAHATEQDATRDVVPWLRQLGFGADEARRAAELCETMPRDASLEERVRLALSYFRVRGTRIVRAAAKPDTAASLVTGPG